MVMSDVVEDILLRLLVSDLLRCKSVCKSWYSLISSPYFVKLHTKHIRNKEDSRRRIAMITSFKDAVYWYSITPEWVPYDKWKIVGSFSGLVCLYSSYEKQILVTNHLTREFVRLAKLPELPSGAWSKDCLGFGYDSFTDDYKVVAVICQGLDRAAVNILSLKSNNWKRFGQVNYRFGHITHVLAKRHGILFNGVLHWFMLDAKYNILIVSFDLAKEEFREIPQPYDTRYVWDWGSLGIFEGHLCIFTKNPPFSIWVMKNYDVVNPSWELLPITNCCEMKDHAIHYMLKDSIQSPYYCDDNAQLSTSAEYIQSPVFVQTLVSPYVNNGRPFHATNNYSTVKVGNVKEKRETEEEEGIRTIQRINI